jgi:pterin-4a-carbinolamine dehydratase
MAHEPPPGWSLDADGKALERSYRFKDFAEALAEAIDRLVQA